MRGGKRIGSGRLEKSESDKAIYIIKTIKFKCNEKYLLEYIENFPGNNFSQKLKNIIIQSIEKK